MIDTTALGPMHPRGSSTSRQILATRNQLEILNRTIVKSSINLSRLRSISERIVGLKAGRLPWVAPTTLAFQPQRSTKMTTTTLSRTHQVDYQDNPSRASSVSFRQLTVSRPLQALLSLPRRVLAATSKAPIVPSNYTWTTPRQQEKPASRVVNAIALLPPQPHRASARHPIAIETIVQALASQFSSSMRAFGQPHPSSERHGSARRRLPAAVAPFGYSHPSSRRLGGFAQHLSRFSETISTEFPSRATAASHSTTMRRNPSYIKDEYDNGNSTGRGDLHLEGSVLGRWLTQHLTREVIRPRAGIITVDPRITPSWGGPSLFT